MTDDDLYKTGYSKGLEDNYQLKDPHYVLFLWWKETGIDCDLIGEQSFVKGYQKGAEDFYQSEDCDQQKYAATLRHRHILESLDDALRERLDSYDILEFLYNHFMYRTSDEEWQKLEQKFDISILPERG